MKPIQTLIVALIVFYCLGSLISRMLMQSDEADRAKVVASLITARTWEITVLPKVSKGGVVTFAIADGVSNYNVVVASGHPVNADFRTLSARQKFFPCECMGGSAILPSAYFAPDTPAVRAKLHLPVK